MNACVISGLSISEPSDFILTNDLFDDCVDVGASTDTAGGPVDGLGIGLVFERSEGFEVLADGLESDGVFQALTAEVSETLLLPDGLQTVFTACGMPNACYDPSTLRITMCYEFFDLFAQAIATPDMTMLRYGRGSSGLASSSTCTNWVTRCDTCWISP